MLQICHEDREKVLAAIRSGHIDAADLSFPCLIDTTVLTMKRHGLLAGLSYTLDDKRRDNLHIPFDILLALAITAKLKLKTALRMFLSLFQMLNCWLNWGGTFGMIKGLSMMGSFPKASCVN